MIRNFADVEERYASSQVEISREVAKAQSSRRRRNLRVAGYLAPVLLVLTLGATLVYEIATSALQSRLISAYARRLTYTIEPGPSSQIVFPPGGPFDLRRGYSRIPEFQSRLDKTGFQTVEQARFSEPLLRLTSGGITPPYDEAEAAGLLIQSDDGGLVHTAISYDHVFRDFSEIPLLVVQTLLFIENRELGYPRDTRQNPVLEWDRLAKAAFLYVGSGLGLPIRLQGGSTLATQIEKYRHSPRGLTSSGPEKLQQIVSASLKAYRTGPETLARRREIILEYLNTMPLGGAPGYGELNGLGEGLNAWFGRSLREVCQVLAAPGNSSEKAVAYKQVLALLTAVRAPSRYLLEDRRGLEERIRSYLPLLVKFGLVEPELASGTAKVTLEFRPTAPVAPSVPYIERKDSLAIRADLLSLLGIRDFYELNRVDLKVRTTLDRSLQLEVVDLFRKLRDPAFIAASGLKAERLLLRGDPSKVVYSLLLMEKTPEGNLLRVQADSLDQPFDLNRGMKLELGSTAKLRTLTHYLEIVSRLHETLSKQDRAELVGLQRGARDPLTRWAAQLFLRNQELPLERMLGLAMERKYSAGPGESFFTGGGLHTFSNFDPQDNHRAMTVQEAFQRSTNLVFIRLMRDIVRYHEAGLSYDSRAVLADPGHPQRERLLKEVAEQEAVQFLAQFYRSYRGLKGEKIVSRLLRKREGSARHLSMLFYAWHPRASVAELAAWLKPRVNGSEPQPVALAASYGKPYLGLTDYAYLLSLHPLEIWLAGELFRDPEISWQEMVRRSEEPRELSYRWLFSTRNRRAQDLRLRIRIERDAFKTMEPYWRNLGFTFGELVPSLATAIGSASDRPSSLADLIGIILNEGRAVPNLQIRRLTFAEGTPYHTVMEPRPGDSRQVLDPAIARTLKKALASVVEEGTGRRLAGVFRAADGGRLEVGGKTGSGDNRYDRFGRGGQLVSSTPVNRTATFVFFIGECYYGVVTAVVDGPEAAHYNFTSGLPVAVLRLLSPSLQSRLQAGS